MMFGQKLKLILMPLLFMIVVFLFLIFHYFHITLCLFKLICGISCPGCGMVRAWYSIIIDHSLKNAFFYHPLFILPLIIVLIFILKNFFTFFKKLYFNSIFWLFILVIVLITYIIRMFIYFPHNEPLKYFDNCILMKIIGLF